MRGFMARRQYPFHLIEPKWQARWEAEQTFRAFNPGETIPADHPFGRRHGLAGRTPRADELPPKYYILDMFPYPSGAGLHVGHPEGYTATDILARYRRARGWHVLHPMGWDAFGLPAEQFAIKTGQHPRVTTERNIATFRRQIKSLGFSYDWSREVDTTDPGYFKWTQWIFLQLYQAWFNPATQRAEPISTLPYPPECTTEAQRRAWRDAHRLAYVSEQPVWWCEALGTVLANEEVVDGRSEVGGFPVVRRPMRQWMLRITAYAERLLRDLDTIEWSDSLKEMQRHWIGRSEGAEVDFALADFREADGRPVQLRVFTTRPDTLFGATYMVLAPEHPLVDRITSTEQRAAVDTYRAAVARKSDLERTELAREKTGVFTGAYAVNPVNGARIPIWIADYVLLSYGTGAIMAVPGHDTRDLEFAEKFHLPVVQVVQPPDPATDWRGFVGNGTAVNSANAEVSLNGLPTPEAKQRIIAWLEAKGQGRRTVNYKLRDWLFSRQRYWGEPFPIVWKRDADGNLYHEAVPEHCLPVLPPELDDYKPTPDGQPPLARAREWVELKSGARRETNTMPQWAGSCWYYLRYLAARDPTRFTDKEAELYWMGGERRPGHFRSHSPEAWAREVDQLIHRAFAPGKRPPYLVEFAPVSDALAALIRARVGLEVTEFRLALDVYAVRHIFHHHGAPARVELRGHLAVTREDLVRLPELLAEPDDVTLVAHQPHAQARLVLQKQVHDLVYVVEAVRGRARQLQVLDLYKRKATARDVTAKAPLSTTSETLRRFTATNTPPAPAVKPTPGVDLYVGGTEHAVLHLLYARFWHKVLYDLGHVSTPEPFFKLVNQGLILGEDGQKMSKSRGNVVNPDDILREYGADAFRLYEMFMGPLEMVKPWSTKGVEGVYRFLGRVWRLFVDEQAETELEQAETSAPESGREGLLNLLRLHAAIRDEPPTPAQLKALHACIKKVTEDLEGLRFNTAIAALMIFVNEALTWPTRPVAVLRPFLQLLAPFAPHLAEELWERLHRAFDQTPPSLTYTPWPEYDPARLVEDQIEIPVQVNGKLRDKLRVPADLAPADLERAALAAPKVQPFLTGKTVKKVIVVPRKLVNIALAP